MKQLNESFSRVNTRVFKLCKTQVYYRFFRGKNRVFWAKICFELGKFLASVFQLVLGGGVLMSEEQLQSMEQVSSQVEQLEQVEGAEGEEEDDESEHLPFPNARVVRIIRSGLKNEHQIKRDVKLAANVLLGEILADISASMDAEPYNSLGIEHFNKAARKYREIALNQKRIRRIQKILEKQRAELDEIVTEIELESNPEASITPGQR